MKKLMIAAAIVCAAVASQAASFQWSTKNVYDINEENYYSGSATLICDTLGITADTQSMSGGKVSLAEFGGDQYVAGTLYTFHYVMTDEAGNTFDSGPLSALAQADSTPSLKFLDQGSWTAAPVPEPTSGLLLLLGVAGMALRRRRA